VQPWLNRPVRDEPRGGGPANKQPPGKVGNPKAPPRGGRVAVKGNATEFRPSREWAQHLAAKSGIMGILSATRGGPFAHHLADDSALGPDAQDAMGTLIANQVGVDSGTGGLSASGPRWGGGGHELGLVAGNGDVRIPNGKGPGGWGPWKAPPKHLRDHNADAPEKMKIVSGETSGYPKELIRREIKKHINEVRHCYSKELQAKPELQGRVMINFTIASTGKVVVARVQQTTLGDAEVESCIAQAFYRWSFPKPPEGIVVVSYPFIFHPTER
jgi:TonB family protein